MAADNDVIDVVVLGVRDDRLRRTARFDDRLDIDAGVGGEFGGVLEECFGLLLVVLAEALEVSERPRFESTGREVARIDRMERDDRRFRVVVDRELQGGR